MGCGLVTPEMTGILAVCVFGMEQRSLQCTNLFHSDEALAVATPLLAGCSYIKLMLYTTLFTFNFT